MKLSLSKIALLASIVIIALFAKPAWQILSGHKYQADEFWRTHSSTSSKHIDHSQWQDLLDEYLISDDPSGVNRVDYESLSDEAQEDLEGYLSYLSSIDVREYSKKEQFAYWVNLYNALTVKVIVDHFPVNSIKEISGNPVIQGPWDDELFEVQGRALSLNDIEHRILRPIWQDHRIHFAVNCASIGCPNLQATAFTADNSEALLELAAQEYLQHPRGFKISGDQLTLSSIFDWYQIDFGDNETEMIATLKPYLNEQQIDSLEQENLKIDYLYDWSLNGVDL